MQINAAKSAIENVIDLVNDANVGLNLTSAQVTVGVPSVFTQAENPRNTQVTLTAVLGQGYSDAVTVTYIRLGLLSGVNPVPAKVTVVETDTIVEVKQKVATALGLVLAQIDASALTMPVDALTDGSVTIAPVANSLLYTDSPRIITLNFIEPGLDGAVTSTSLNGFDPVV